MGRLSRRTETLRVISSAIRVSLNRRPHAVPYQHIVLELDCRAVMVEKSHHALFLVEIFLHRHDGFHQGHIEATAHNRGRLFIPKRLAESCRLDDDNGESTFSHNSFSHNSQTASASLANC